VDIEYVYTDVITKTREKIEEAIGIAIFFVKKTSNIARFMSIPSSLRDIVSCQFSI